MANADTARGFTPVGYRSGQAYTGAARRYYVSTTAALLGVGDAVIKISSTDTLTGLPEVKEATAGSAMTGVIVGVDPKVTDLSAIGTIATGDTSYVMVADDPDLLFEIQEVSGGTPIAIADIGQHIDQTATTANTTLGRSTLELNNAAMDADNTFIIEGLVQREDNIVGEHAKWLVSINLHTERNASATSRTEV